LLAIGHFYFALTTDLLSRFAHSAQADLFSVISHCVGLSSILGDKDKKWLEVRLVFWIEIGVDKSLNR